MNNKYLSRWLWLAVPMVGGALCALVRRWQLSSAFEGDLSLPRPMAAASVILVLLLLLCGAGLFLLCRRQPVARSLYRSGRPAAWAEGDIGFMAALVVAAFLALTAAPTLFNQGRQLWASYQLAKTHGLTVPGGNNGVLAVLTAITSLLAFAGLLAGARSTYRGLHKGRMSIVLPAVNGCLWLMEIYRGSAADPVRWNYSPLLLAIVCGMLFYLEWAGLYAGAPAPRRTLWLAAMTVVLSAAALAGNWDLSSALLLLSQLAAALAFLWRVPTNLKHPPESVLEQAPAEEKLEEETHE